MSINSIVYRSILLVSCDDLFAKDDTVSIHNCRVDKVVISSDHSDGTNTQHFYKTL